MAIKGNKLPAERLFAARNKETRKNQENRRNRTNLRNRRNRRREKCNSWFISRVWHPPSFDSSLFHFSQSFHRIERKNPSRARKNLARISQVSRKNLARTIKSNRFRLRSEISNLILYRDLHSSWKWRRRVWSNLDATIQPALKFRNSLDHSSVQQILKNELCWSLSVEPGPKPIGWNLTQFQDEMISGKRNDLSRLIKSGHWTESILSLFPLSLLIHSVHDCRRFNVYLMSWLDQIELNFEGERWPRRVISQ